MRVKTPFSRARPGGSALRPCSACASCFMLYGPSATMRCRGAGPKRLSEFLISWVVPARATAPKMLAAHRSEGCFVNAGGFPHPHGEYERSEIEPRVLRGVWHERNSPRL